MKNHIIALWTHPRAASTAFERYFIERNDHEVLHEPFSYEYFINKKNEKIDYIEDLNHPKKYIDIKNMIVKKSEYKNIFHKDMCYHCDLELINDIDFLSNQINTFLIRDPYKSIVSHSKVRPDFSLNSAGYESMYDVYKKVKELGLKTLIIDADDLLDNPISIMKKYCEFVKIDFNINDLNWSRGMVKSWETWPGWHESVAQSTGFNRNNNEKKCNIDDPKIKAYISHHYKFYNELYKNRFVGN